MRTGSREVDGNFKWKTFDENTAAAMCYTSGTTGDPKGVLYSHRSNVMHALMANTGDSLGANAGDTMLPVVPLFHANSWGIAFSAPSMGTKLVLPGAKLDGASVFELMESEKVTHTAGVPTVWLMLLNHIAANHLKLPHLRMVVCGGSAMPRSMIKAFIDMGVKVRHAWGMTEMSPIGTLAALKPPFTDLEGDARLDILQTQGYPPFGVQMKITDDAGKELPWDGKTFGRLKVSGPAVSKAYFRVDTDILDEDGFFDTGDVATIDQYGYMRITDRSKDVIKSGGEWISSIDLENLAVGHPAVAEAAVIGVHHPKWDERPLLIVQLKQGQKRHAGGHPEIHGRQDRKMVDAGRCRLRRRHSSHRHGKDPEDRAARYVQGLSFSERGGVRRSQRTASPGLRVRTPAVWRALTMRIWLKHSGRPHREERVLARVSKGKAGVRTFLAFGPCVRLHRVQIRASDTPRTDCDSVARGCLARCPAAFSGINRFTDAQMR